MISLISKPIENMRIKDNNVKNVCGNDSNTTFTIDNYNSKNINDYNIHNITAMPGNAIPKPVVCPARIQQNLARFHQQYITTLE